MTRMRIRSKVFRLPGKVWTPRRAVKAPATLGYCQVLCCGYIANSPLDTENQVSQKDGENKRMSEKGKVVTPAAPGLINKEDIPPVLPILPLRNSVFFPGGVLPLAVGRQKTIALIKDAV